MGFFLNLKQNCPRNKGLSLFLLNIFELELILSLLVDFDTTLYKNIAQFTFHHFELESQTLSHVILAINGLIMILTIQQGKANRKFPLYSTTLHYLTIRFIKIFPYIGFIPLTQYCLSSIKEKPISIQIVEIVNILFFILFYELNEVSNWAYRFIEVDYCNQRGSNQLSAVLIIVYLIVSKVFNPLYASFIYLARGILKIVFVFYRYDYPLIQELDLFYGMFSVYLFGIILGAHLSGINFLQEVRLFTFLAVFGLVICYISVSRIILRLNHERIKNSPQISLIDKDQRESLPENLYKTIEESENVLRILARVLLEREKLKKASSNNYSKWWQIFNRVVMVHRIQCEQLKCFCLSLNQSAKSEEMIYILELLKIGENLCLLNTKLYNLKIMLIYLFIEIAKKPLKAYYEIMRLKQEKINSNTQIELEYLIKETRECFDQIFLKNKAKNQELELLKVIEYEELVIYLNKNVDDTFEKVINFYELFLYSTVKTSSIKTESKEIFVLKKLIEEEVYNIILNYSENSRVNIIIFAFYRFLEVYKSKESELKKISNQQLLKKRIYQKNQINIFNSKFGSVFIDLVEERGKILNLTSNVCDAFEYSRDEMISFNIRRFMGNIYARHHDRFISNFVEKGKIKLLKEKERLVFAKNKRKFIFPVNVRLKAEYLLSDEFGASSLINTVETNSEYMMVGQNGKLEEITENLYKKLFNSVFREEVAKCNRLCVFKLLPSLNKMYDSSEENISAANKIYEGILVYSLDEEYLVEKFRYARDNSIDSSNNLSTRSGLSGLGKLSIMSASISPCNESIEKSEVINFLTETFKVFLVDINIFKLKGFKVSYKISKIQTSEFELILLEFITFEPIEGIAFQKELVNELKNVSEIYQLSEEFGPISTHLRDIETLIKDSKSEEMYKILNNQNSEKIDFSVVPQFEGELKRKRESYYQNKIIENNNDEQKNSDNSFIESINKDKVYQEYEASEQSSVLGNTESDSKKQILINAFNSKESAISKNAFHGMNIAIGGLILLLILLSFFSISYVSENQNLWMEVRFILTINQAIEFKIALQETEIFQNKMSKPQSSFLNSKKLLSVEKIKANLKEISKKGISSQISDNYFGQTVKLYDAETGKVSDLTFIEFLNQYLYMLMYESQKNIENLRNNYGSYVLLFNLLEQEKLNTIDQFQTSNFQKIIILLGLYAVVLLFTGIFSLPIFTYYKNEEANVIGLLSYLNTQEIRKEIRRLKNVKELMKSKENNSALIFTLSEKANEKKLEKEKSHDIKIKGANKTIKISSESDGNSFKITKIIGILLFLITFLSNFAIASFYITYNTSKNFKYNLEAARLTFKFENKSPLLINTLLANVNRFISDKPLIVYPDEIYREGSSEFFGPIQELEKEMYKGNKISEMTKFMFSSKLCEIIYCSETAIFEKSMSVSFEYLVYLFKDKFEILLPEGKYVLTSDSIEKWIRENEIEDFVLWLEEIITISHEISDQIDRIFKENEINLEIRLLILAVVLNPLNILLIIYAQRKFLNFLNRMLVESEEIFRHFNVSVLVENTYLTSYFNSKIKQNK